MSISALLVRKGNDVSTIRSTKNVVEAIQQLHQERIGVLVVIDRKGQLAGMFSERDVIHALGAYGAKALQDPVHEYMTPDVTTCAPDDRIDDVMAIMSAHRIRHLPVMNNDRLVGLVSMGDLVKHRLDEKEIEAGVLLDIARGHS